MSWLAAALSPAPAPHPPVIHAAQEDGELRPLFNGRDLAGWENVNCAPDTFTVRDGIIHSTGKPICAMRTDRMYENFILELDYQHLEPGGNAGLFVWADALPARGQPFLRAIEVQILDGRNSANYTSHGDVFAIHGARLTPDRPHPAGSMRSLPSERRARPAGQWNHYRVTANDGRVTLAVNGKAVSGGYDISPRKGHIALESEGAPTLFRNIRIRELPSTGPVPAEDTADEADGFAALYSGVDFDGWRVPAGGLAGWAVNDWRIDAGASAAQPLWTDDTYEDFTLMLDWRCGAGRDAEARREAADAVSGLLIRGHAVAPVFELSCGKADRRGWSRGRFELRGNRLSVTINGEQVLSERAIGDLPPRGEIGLAPPSDPMQFANPFVRVEH